ncbi:glutamate mutase subunit E [Nocardia tenerifensis]|uniref:Glutamate mutase subunit E n=1 Tax=Nocardia tenerifensis TaxID=228006 RepID=A0A318KC42_9NOCA|nr:methylaspartate mutase [Nocardia tenerifensis]PXX71467.1 glutamate mutase subunit E [Nocardia tenerifensis]
MTARSAPRPPVDFGEFVRRTAGAGGLVVQPRMGFGDPSAMRAGLRATRDAAADTVGTITLDSYTRVGDLAAVDRALREHRALNGYPIVNYDGATTANVLKDIRGERFPVQVRHGSAVPLDIFAALARCTLNATEGGPVSYCLPYGRTPLAASVHNWAEGTRRFAGLLERGIEPHLETFGGCMLGQLCPPSQLVAISLLEALFFARYGIRSVSVSYAQQSSFAQDVEAVHALRRLCAELLPTENWHVVVYAYMGMYPMTDGGAYLLLGAAARLAVRTGAARLIVKTVAESRRIPTIAENVAALEHAARIARETKPDPHDPGDSETYLEARALVEAVLELHADPGRALLRAFERGYLDIPYCVHPDNHGRTRSYIDDHGWLRWSELGSLPLRRTAGTHRPRTVTSAGLLRDLSYVRREFDDQAWREIEYRGPVGSAGFSCGAGRVERGTRRAPKGI